MTEPLSGGGLRTVDPPSLAASPGRVVLHRFAKRGTQQVVTMKCVEGAAGAVAVECEVYPVGSLQVEPVAKGPYAFATEAEARRFVDEATLALQYLGCEVFESGTA